MSFADAVRSALSQYVGFTGRARRSEYWWFYLFVVLVSFVARLVDEVLGTGQVIGTIAGLALLLPILAAGARRLHDTDRTAWWLLIGLVPIVGAIVLIVFFVMDSDRGSNRFGPSVKYPAGQVVPGQPGSTEGGEHGPGQYGAPA